VSICTKFVYKYHFLLRIGTISYLHFAHFPSSRMWGQQKRKKKEILDSVWFSLLLLLFSLLLCLYTFYKLTFVMEISIRTSFCNCVKGQRLVMKHEDGFWFVKVCGWNVVSMPFWIIRKLKKCLSSSLLVGVHKSTNGIAHPSNYYWKRIYVIRIRQSNQDTTRNRGCSHITLFTRWSRSICHKLFFFFKDCSRNSDNLIVISFLLKLM
jgi:hypothetical protein